MIHTIAPENARFAGVARRLGSNNLRPGQAAGAVRTRADRNLGPVARGMVRAPQRRAERDDHRLRHEDFGQLLQGAAAARAARSAVSLDRDRQRARRDAHAGISREESERQGAVAGTRRRPPISPSRTRSCAISPKARRFCRTIAGSVRRRCSGCSSSNTATSRTSRSRASSAVAGRRIIRATPNCRACASAATQALAVMEKHLAAHEWFVGERYSIADIALFAYTHCGRGWRFRSCRVSRTSCVARARAARSRVSCRCQPLLECSGLPSIPACHTSPDEVLLQHGSQP